MDTGYEEFEKIKLGQMPGKDLNMAVLFQCYFCLSFIIAEFSKLEMILDTKLIEMTRSDFNFQHQIWPNIAFSKKIRMLQEICDKNTLRVKGKVIGEDYSQKLKDSKLIAQLTRCNAIRNEVVHGLWMGTAIPTNEPEYFQIFYQGESSKWTTGQFLERLAIMTGVTMKLHAFR